MPWGELNDAAAPNPFAEPTAPLPANVFTVAVFAGVGLGCTGVGLDPPEHPAKKEADKNMIRVLGNIFFKDVSFIVNPLSVKFNTKKGLYT